MKIALIGASDRNNFGDLIMPIIFIEQYKKYRKNNDILFDVYGLVKSDLSNINALPTKPLYNCYNNCDIAIVVGGDILTVDYKTMYLHFIKSDFFALCFRVLSKLFPNYIEKCCKRKLNGKSTLPWILDKEQLNCNKLIYNTVGGISNFSNNIQEIIKNFDYISIRNRHDYEYIKNINPCSYLYPDSVVSISTILEDDNIISNVSEEIINKTKKDYFTFQINNKIGSKNITELSNQILKICNIYNLNCILLPIGYAKGHDDEKILKKIFKKCNSKSVILFNRDNNLYETTYILKNSKAFVGTSLHGVVVSTSYKVPHMVISDKLPKLNNYIKTWKTSPILNTPICDIFNNFEKIYNNNKYKEDLIFISDNLIKKALENFEKINYIIDEGMKNE